MVVLDAPLPLPEGTVVVIEEEGPMPSGAQVLADVKGLFPPEDLREIEDALRNCRAIDADGW